jgi:hypothetical protein
VDGRKADPSALADVTDEEDEEDEEDEGVSQE